MGDVIEQAADVILRQGRPAVWTSAEHVARALAESGLLRSDAEAAVIAAAETLGARDADLRTGECIPFAEHAAREDRHQDALNALLRSVAALRAARKETP